MMNVIAYESKLDTEEYRGLIVTVVTVYRCDRTTSCGRYRNDVQQSP